MSDYQALAEHAIRSIADHHDDTTEALLIVDVRKAIEQAVQEVRSAYVSSRDAAIKECAKVCAEKSLAWHGNDTPRANAAWECKRDILKLLDTLACEHSLQGEKK